MQSNIVNVRYYKVGHCKQCEALSIKGGKWKNIVFPSLVVLIEHKIHGCILFDVGYSKKFFDVTQSYPNKLYPTITPVTLSEDEELPQQLLKDGIKINDIKHIVLSHLHADHIAGLVYFRDAKIHLTKECYEYNNSKGGIGGLVNGFIKELFNEIKLKNLNFIEGCEAINLPKFMLPFTEGFDIFGDRSLLLIELPGHAKGQIGLLVNGEEKIFLIGDAAWSTEAVRENLPPNLLTFLFHNNKNEYFETLAKLHQLYKNNAEIKIIPSHCNELWVANA